VKTGEAVGNWKSMETPPWRVNNADLNCYQQVSRDVTRNKRNENVKLESFDAPASSYQFSLVACDNRSTVISGREGGPKLWQAFLVTYEGIRRDNKTGTVPISFRTAAPFGLVPPESSYCASHGGIQARSLCS